MAFSTFFKSILHAYGVEFTEIPLVGPESSIPDVPLDHTIKARLLTNDADLYLVLYPASHSFAAEKLSKAMGHEIRPLKGEALAEVLQGLSNGTLPRLNTPGGLHVLLDEALSNQTSVYYCAADTGQGFILETDELQDIISDEIIGVSFSEPSVTPTDASVEMPVVSVRERLKKLYDLPPMSDTASQIFALRAKKDFTTDELSAVVECDPALAAQVIRYANSAFFGHAGSVKTLKDAIFRVLGVSAVMDLALGLSIGRQFTLPADGPLGGERLWREATYSAALMQRLSLLMPSSRRLDFGTAYLVGLLHDFGVFVIANLFKSDFAKINRLFKDNPKKHVTQIERSVLGVTHTEVGGLVMKAWEMPEELVIATREHHNSQYEGKYEDYINLLLITERLLKTHGISDAASDELPLDLIEKVGLLEEDVYLAADEIIQEGERLNAIALQMCA